MKFWTAHIRPGTPPELVREGFSWGALIFGPIWLAMHRVWLPAVLTLTATVLIVFLTSDVTAIALLAALVVLIGVSGQDLRRWSLDHHGYLLSQVLAAHDESEALARLLARRPDLKGSFLPPRTAR